MTDRNSDQNLEQAIRALKSHVARDEADHEARHDLSVLLGQAGHLAESITHAQRVTKSAPDFAEGWLNLGNLQALTGDQDQAITSLEKACSCAPDDPRMWFNLGNLLAQSDRLQASIDAFEKAQAHAPNEPSVLASLALAYRRTNQVPRAIATYEAALSLQPNNTWVHSNLLVSRLYNLGETDQSLFDAHRAWGAQHGEPNPPVQPTLARGKKPLRIGYVSGDFRRHPIGYFLQGCLAHHNRNNFEIVCISDTRSQDDITTQLIEHADEWIETAGLGRDAFCTRVKEAGLDILIDLSGHFRHNRLPEFARRLAPVQATWAGYVGTTGVPAMDWLIADHTHAPDEYAACATERIARLPENYVCYAPPDDLPDVGKLPALKQGHITFGCFNNFAKVNDSVLALWAQILTAVPDSKLLLKTARLGQSDAQEHVVKLMGDLGITRDRLILGGASPHRALLDAYNKVDIALDPFPYSGGLTTLEALLMGVPIVTKTGATFAGRHSSSHLRAVGLPEWVAADDQEYVGLAVSCAQDMKQLGDLRLTLRQKLLASPVCDHAGFTRKLEQAYQGMWAQSGIPDGPKIIDVK